MPKKKYPPSIPWDDYLLPRLRDPEAAALYIEAALEDSPEVLLIALRHVAQAHGIASIAKKANLGRESLYKSLSANGNPELKTINGILHAMGMQLTVSPLPLTRLRKLRGRAPKNFKFDRLEANKL